MKIAFEGYLHILSDCRDRQAAAEASPGGMNPQSLGALVAPRSGATDVMAR
jgi:hypothetical protein